LDKEYFSAKKKSGKEKEKSYQKYLTTISLSKTFLSFPKLPMKP
jgi:hypothetical protein